MFAGMLKFDGFWMAGKVINPWDFTWEDSWDFMVFHGGISWYFMGKSFINGVFKEHHLETYEIFHCYV